MGLSYGRLLATLSTAAACAAAMALAGWTPPAHAQECIDLTPDAGGELEFQGSGTPDHLAVAEGEVCPGASEVWTFSTLPIDIDQHVGVRVYEQTGSISIRVLTPSSEEVALTPGEEYHTTERFEATYQVTVTGSGTSLSQYRLEACRSISPCRFVIGLPPPGPFSPPDGLSPPIEPPTPRECLTPENLSPPRDVGCLILPATGQSGDTPSAGIRIAVLAIAGATLLVAVGSLVLGFKRHG